MMDEININEFTHEELVELVNTFRMFSAFGAEIAADYEKRFWAEKAARADDLALIANLKQQIAELKHEKYAAKSESSQHLDQAKVDDTCQSGLPSDAHDAASNDAPISRSKPSRRPFPEHLARQRRVEPAPKYCSCCGGTNLRKLGEDITETLEVIPKQYIVIQTVREKFSCRHCETINQAPAPHHVIPRAFAGPSFLAMMTYEKYGQHQPLNRQSERFGREGIDLRVSTMVGLLQATADVLKPIYERLLVHVLSGRCIHGDDTTVPVLAKGKTKTGRVWTYVRDEAPFGSQAPPGVIFTYSPDRKAGHIRHHIGNWKGTLISDAYAGYRTMSKSLPEGTVVHAYCWAHARRQFFKVAIADKAYTNSRQSAKTKPTSPIAREAVNRIDDLFAIERKIKEAA